MTEKMVIAHKLATNFLLGFGVQKVNGLPKISLEKLKNSLSNKEEVFLLCNSNVFPIGIHLNSKPSEQGIKNHFLTKESWLDWLIKQNIVNKTHIKIATEAVLLAGALKGGLNEDLVILNDDAGQFNIPFLIHALCCIQEKKTRGFLEFIPNY